MDWLWHGFGNSLIKLFSHFIHIHITPLISDESTPYPLARGLPKQPSHSSAFGKQCPGLPASIRHTTGERCLRQLEAQSPRQPNLAIGP